MTTTLAPGHFHDVSRPQDVEAAPAIPAMRLVQSPERTRRLARWLMACVLVMPFALALVPWMQTIKGKGRVVAFSPIEREQRVNAPHDGLIVDFFGHIEGSRVKKGEKLFEMADTDSQLVNRVTQQVEALRLKQQASRDKLENSEAQIALFESVVLNTIQAATFGIEMAKNKMAAAEQTLRAANADYVTSKGIHDRTEKLFKDPLHLASKQEWELAQYKMNKAMADVEKAKADREAAVNDLRTKEAELKQKKAEADAKVRDARTKRDAASSDLASAEKELRDVESKLAQLGRFLAVAPMDGILLRILRAKDTEFVKKGDPVMVLVPDTDHYAVELWIDGNDAPLVSRSMEIRRAKGEETPVRLQFEGWPAVQFAGWPSVAVGTFGGVVKLIDATDDGKGKFRILVTPDPNDPYGRDAWPDEPYLRQGVQANGWVLLNQVPLGWELWRQFNGFPPAINAGDESDKDEGLYKRKK